MAKKAEKTEVAEKATNNEGKLKALGLAMDQITKQFGDGSIMKLGEAHKVDVELIPSGALSLDIALGGGYPKGRIIEIYGPESSGKSKPIGWRRTTLIINSESLRFSDGNALTVPSMPLTLRTQRS